MAIRQIGEEISWRCDTLTFADFIRLRDYINIHPREKRNVAISDYHHSLLTIIQEQGLIFCDYKRLASMFVEIGILIACNNHRVSNSTLASVNKHFNKKQSSWEIENKLRKEIEKLKHITNVNNNPDLANILDCYSNNSVIAKTYEDLFNRKPSKTKIKNNISGLFIDKCNTLLKIELETKHFRIKKGNGNDRIDLSLAGEFTALIKSIQDQVWMEESTSEIIRMCLLIGMYNFVSIITGKNVEIIDNEIYLAINSIKNLYTNIIGMGS